MISNIYHYYTLIQFVSHQFLYKDTLDCIKDHAEVKIHNILVHGARHWIVESN